MTWLLAGLAVLLAFLCGMALAFALVAVWAAQDATQKVRDHRPAKAGQE